ncbi:hypothetical protein ACFSJQ_02985 [Vibrio olivae]
MKWAIVTAIVLQLVLASLTQGLPRSLAELSGFVLLLAIVLERQFQVKQPVNFNGSTEHNPSQ